MDKITPFRFWCQKVLPLVYDDSLSYYEALCKFRDKLNEVIQWTNEYENELDALIDEKINALRNEYRAEFASYQEEIGKQLNEIQASIDSVLAKADAKIEANEAWVKAKILDLLTQINLQLSIIYQVIEANRTWNKNYTDNSIEKLIDELPILTDVMVRCPANGEVMGIQRCLNIMYDTLRIFGLTCGEYDALQITCGEYDSKGLTCLQYDLYVKLVFWPYMPWHKVYSGITGNVVSLQQGQYEIWQYLRASGLTVASYDAMNLTAGAYDNLNISAYTYDWLGVKL